MSSDEEMGLALCHELQKVLEKVASVMNAANDTGLQIDFVIGRNSLGTAYVQQIRVIKVLV